jgi:hypothetical protein
MNEYMKRHGAAKFLALLAVLAAAVMGGLELERDPSLRELQTHPIASLERGQTPRELQYVQIPEVEALGPAVVNTYTRKRTTTVTIYLAVGSPEAAQAYAAGRRPPLKLWFRLPHTYSSESEAQAALKNSLLLPAGPHQGIWSAMGEDLAQASAASGDVQGAQLLKLNDTPTTRGVGAGLLAAAAVSMLLWLLWMFSEWRGWQWAESVQREGAQRFDGMAGRVGFGVVGTPVAAVSAYILFHDWIDDGSFSSGALTWLLLGVGVTAFVLLTKDTLTLIGPQKIERLRGSHTESCDVAAVRELFTAQPFRAKVPGGFELRGKFDKPFSVGNDRWMGTVTRWLELGVALRTVLFERLAPAYANALAAGKRFDFGGVKLSAQGLSKGDKDALPWSEMERVDLDSKTLSFKRRGKMLAWAKLKVHKTPNLDVLLHQLREHQVTVRAKDKAVRAYWGVSE